MRQPDETELVAQNPLGPGDIVDIDFDGEPAPVVSREDLIESKKVGGRTRDRKHARSLRKPRNGK